METLEEIFKYIWKLRFISFKTSNMVEKVYFEWKIKGRGADFSKIPALRAVAQPGISSGDVPNFKLRFSIFATLREGGRAHIL